MATITHANAALRIAGTDGRSVCSISGVDPQMTPANAAGFVRAIEKMYNTGSVTARLSVISDITWD